MESNVRVGDIVADKYRVEKVLGQGGMGVVLSAFHLHLRQRVALKFLTDGASQSSEAVTRFLREARLAVQIQSEHVARVTDVGTLDNGAPYMVMEYLAGQDLKQVSEAGPLPVQVAVDYVLQACDAVAEAHALGIIHRDLKPANLFLTRRADGTALIKVLDFGISKSITGSDGASLNMTSSTAVMGSPQYMSPEQIRSSRDVDARSDIWSLGAILHELLSGSPAYDAETLPGLLAKIIADPPTPLSGSNPEIRPELQHIVATCLQKELPKRFADIAELAAHLKPLASREVAPLAARIARLLGKNKAGTSNEVPEPVSQIATDPQGTPSQATFGKDKAVSSGSFEPPAARTNGTWSRTGDHVTKPPTTRGRGRRIALGIALSSVGLASWLTFSVPELNDTPVAETPLTVAVPPADSKSPPPKPASAARPRTPLVQLIAEPVTQPLHPGAPSPETPTGSPKTEKAPPAKAEARAPKVASSPVLAKKAARKLAVVAKKPLAKKVPKRAAKTRAAKPKAPPKRVKFAPKKAAPKPVRQSRPSPLPASRNKTDSLDLFDDTK